MFCVVITTLLSQLLGIPSALALMLTLLDRLLIATVGRQMPSSTCFLIEILNLEKNLGVLATKRFKVYHVHVLESLRGDWWAANNYSARLVTICGKIRVDVVNWCMYPQSGTRASCLWSGVDRVIILYSGKLWRGF